MIAFLSGTIRFHETRAIIVDVHGVGYRVYAGNSVLRRTDGEAIELFTHHHISDDAMDLYGFASADELGLFESLLKVSGVGPKSALSILSDNSAEAVRQSILNADASLLLNVSGIGRKTAERIILELSGSLAQSTNVGPDDALDALERLGYTRREAAEALRHVGAEGDVRDRIRAALKSLNKKP
jgi:Holliday junction DNA helicase RuvA